MPKSGEPVTFDDANPEPVPATFMTGNEDRVIQSINHRPRRLGGPAAAVAAVLVLIVVLILTGLHSNTRSTMGSPPPPPPRRRPTRRPARSTHDNDQHHHDAPPAVSAPTAASAHAATYTVAAPSYSLNLAATTGQCWVDVTNTATGSVLFTTTLLSGQSHAITATGPVTVIAGAPGVVQRHRQRCAGDVAAGQPGAVHAPLPNGPRDGDWLASPHDVLSLGIGWLMIPPLQQVDR